MESTATVNPDEKKFIVDSGASVHMMSNMGLPREELPTTVIMANGSTNAMDEASPRERFGHVCHKFNSSKTLHLYCLCFRMSGKKVKTQI